MLEGCSHYGVLGGSARQSGEGIALIPSIRATASGGGRASAQVTGLGVGPTGSKGGSQDSTLDLTDRLSGESRAFRAGILAIMEGFLEQAMLWRINLH